MNDDSLLSHVLARAPRIPFVRLVRHIERLLPGRTLVGEKGPFSREALRFKHDPSLVFHARDVALVTREADGPVEITTSFAGLTGSVSPLPLFFVEGLDGADEDGALQRELLDIFHHRLLGLLVRGLTRFDYASDQAADQSDVRSRELLLLAGLLPDHAARLTDMSPAWLLRLAPLLIAAPANAERLKAGLQDHLREVLGAAQVTIVPFVGGYVRLEQDVRPRLGVDLQLGRNSALGRRVLCAASRVRVGLGPLSPEQCAELGPGGTAHRALVAVSRLLVPEHIDIEFELSPTHAPPLRLGRQGGSRLGGNSWLPSRSHAVPVRFSPQPYAS